MRSVIGIDIGGTNIKYAVVNGEKLLYEGCVKTAHGEQFLGLVEGIISELLAKAGKDGIELGGVGIGCPGIITHDGVVRFSNNISLKDFPLAQTLTRKFNIPVFVINDANAAALAEFHFGAGRDCNSMVMLTIGTGVGCAMILNGRLHQGFQGATAGGHIIIRQNGRRCNCGSKGCLEQYASMTALLRSAKHFASRTDSVLSNREINGVMLLNAVKAKDKAATQAFDRFLSDLSAGITSILNLIRPEIIVLGGAISQQGDYLIDRLAPLCEATFAKKALAPFQIKTAELKNAAGIIGASLTCE